MRTIGLSHSAAEKFARFLLEQASDSGKTEGEVCLTLTLTHEEIAQMIGSSRETVTRLFSDFKKRQLVQVKGSMIVVQETAALRKFAESLADSLPESRPPIESRTDSVNFSLDWPLILWYY